MIKKIISGLFLIIGCISCNTQNDTVKNITVKELKTIIENKKVQLIDVRTLEEYEQGHIKNALLVDYFSDDFKDQINRLDKSKPVYFYCRSGRRSAKASKISSKLGFKEIYNVKGGYLAWVADNN